MYEDDYWFGNYGNVYVFVIYNEFEWIRRAFGKKDR